MSEPEVIDLTTDETMDETAEEDDVAWIPGQCFLCGERCDEASQMCGVCVRSSMSL